MTVDGESNRPSIGIVSTEFVGCPGHVWTYEAESLRRAAEAAGAAVHLIDPTRIALGVERDAPWAGYVQGEAIERDVFHRLSVLLVRRTRSQNLGISEMIYDLMLFLPRAAPRLLILDPPECFLQPLSKVPSMLERAQAGIPQGDRMVVARELAGRVELPLPYPVITKPTHGWVGEGVAVSSNPEEVQRHTDRLDGGSSGSPTFAVLVEHRLEIEAEFRVVVVGARALGCAQKHYVGGPTRNVAGGGTWTSATDPEAERLAVRAAAAHGHAFSGVDIIKSGDRYHVLECNRCPQFREFDRVTGAQVADEIVRFALAELARRPS